MSLVTVQLFAAYADRFGRASLDVPLPPGSTVKDLIDAIRLRSVPGTLPDSPGVAVNRRFATPDVPVSPGDEIALIPPVAGG